MDSSLSRVEKVQTVMQRIGSGEISLEGEERSWCIFWLGGVNASKDEDSLLLLDLVIAGRITLSEARTEAPARWIKAITYFLSIDGITATPENALQRWRGMSPTEREVLIQEYDREAKRLGGVENPRREPTPRDLERLEMGAEALALPQPGTLDEVHDQLTILHQGIAALQSLDDLGTDRANARAMRDMQTLIKKYDNLKDRLQRES